MDAKKCDLCKKYYDRLPRRMARIEQYGHLRDFQICEYAGMPLDLCDECADLFQKFIDERTGWKNGQS